METSIVCYDVITYLFSLFDLLSQIMFVSTAHDADRKFHIIDLYNISECHRLKLTDDILQQAKFLTCNSLNAYDIKAITNVTHLKQLTTLNAGGLCGITINGIIDLHLEHLFLMVNTVHADIGSRIDLSLLCHCNAVETDPNGEKTIAHKPLVIICRRGTGAIISRISKLDITDATKCLQHLYPAHYW